MSNAATYGVFEHFRMFWSIYVYHLPKSLRDTNEDGFASTAGVLASGLLEDTTVHGLQNARKAKGQTCFEKFLVVWTSAYGFKMTFDVSQCTAD